MRQLSPCVPTAEHANLRACAPQQEKLSQRETRAAQLEGSPCSLQLEKACMQQQGSSAVINKFYLKKDIIRVAFLLNDFKNFSVILKTRAQILVDKILQSPLLNNFSCRLHPSPQSAALQPHWFSFCCSQTQHHTFWRTFSQHFLCLHCSSLVFIWPGLCGHLGPV